MLFESKKTQIYLTSLSFNRRVASKSFLVSPRDYFVCPVPIICRNERNWMKKNARVSEKVVSPGLPGLQVATHLFNADIVLKNAQIIEKLDK